MPRLTDQQYLTTYRRLLAIWLQDVGRYSYLRPRDQRHLHDYFRPSEELSDEALLEHREQISRERPSLPQQAGRALAKLRQQETQPVPLVQTHGGRLHSRDRQISVRSVVRPTPDLKKLAQALVASAIEQATEDLATRKPDGRPHSDTSSGQDVLDGGLGETEAGSDLPDRQS